MLNNSTYPYPPGDEQWYFLALIIILAIICVICNALIVVVYAVEKSIRNHANMFVVSLACADLVVGIVATPLWIANAAPDVRLDYYYTSIDILCCSASIFNCALLSIERGLKISFPYWYTNTVTTFRLKIVIVLGWIAAILAGSFSLLRGTNRKNLPYIIFVTLFVYILPVLAIFISYTCIFVVAHKHAKSIRRQNCQVDSETIRTRMSESKTAWRLSVFILVFIICWTPFFVRIWGRLLLKHRPPLYFLVLANTLSFINAAINPFLYALFNPLFRKGIAKFYKKRATRQKLEHSRRNEMSTCQTNVTNSSPSTRRAALLSQAEGSELNSLYKKLLTNSVVEHKQNNNDNKTNYETSL